MKLLPVVLVLALAGAVHAQGAPTTISFAARLTDANGTPVAGNHDFIFTLYDAAQGGTSLWSETHSALNVPVDGVLYLDLGLQTPLTSSLLNGSVRYLEISLDGTVTDARVLIESVPYALSSALSSHATNSDQLGGQPASSYQHVIGSPCMAGNYVGGIGSDGSLMCFPDLNTAYTAGTGLSLSGTMFSVNTNAIQARVTGMCASGAIADVNGDGSVTCLTAGSGLAIVGTTESVDTNAIQARVTTACGAGSYYTAIDGLGNATCTAAQRPITGVPCAAGTYMTSVASGGAATCTAVTLGPQSGRVDAKETTGNGNTSYVDLTTAGPTATVDVPASANVMVTVTASITTSGTGFMSFTGCGVSAADNIALSASGPQQASATYFVNCASTGTQTFTAKYRNLGGGASNSTFQYRHIIVVPMP